MNLYTNPVSTACRPVMQFCIEADIDCEFIPVDLMKGEQRQPAYLSMNPNGLVPTLEDDGFILTESSAILKYIADKAGHAAYPKDLKQRARVNELMDWFNTNFYRDYGYNLIYPQLFPHHKRRSDEAHAGAVDWGKAKSAAGLALLDEHYFPGPGPYLGGFAEPTIADYFGAAIITLGECIGVSLGAYPNISRWLDLMRARPSWRETNAIFDGFAASLAGKPFETLGAVAS